MRKNNAKLTPFSLFASSASGNDSTGRVAAGGIELLKTEDIQMVSEVLEISLSEIQVKYHFLNTSDHDIKTIVAFPMPAFNGLGLVGGEENQRPLDSFQVFVNGDKVSVNKNRVFLVNNIDVTDKLRKAGLSDEQIFNPEFPCMWGDVEDAEQAGCKLTEKQNEIVKSMHAQKGKIKETAYWEQTFPAGREIEVVHRYKPFVGNTMVLVQNTRREACLGNRMLKAMGGKINEFGYAEVPNGIRDVEYILGTGRNWKGPIKNFKLIIKKNSTHDTVTLCFPGKPVKTGPLTIEYSHKDFVPQDRVIVFFYPGSDYEN